MAGKSPLQGKTAVITGATSGIGLASMVALAKEGAYVIGVGRLAEHGLEAVKKVNASCPSAQMDTLVAELSLQSRVRQLAADIRARLEEKGVKCLDVLVNNAGIYSGKKVRTEEGIELMLAVNHIAPFLLTHELIPLLMASPCGRVITVSSASHHRGRLHLKRLNNPLIYFGLWRYEVTKLANVLFTYELNRRLAHTSIRAFAVDPGLVNTDIGMKHTGSLANLVWKYRRQKGARPEVPARTVAFLSREEALQNANQYYWRDCKPKEPSRLALQEDAARDLWNVTSRLCGIYPEWIPAEG